MHITSVNGPASPLVFLLLFLAAPQAHAQTGPALDSTAMIARGAELFSRNCQRCHTPRGPAEWGDREWVITMQHMETRANITRDRMEFVRAFLLASNEAARYPGRARGMSRRPRAGADHRRDADDRTDGL